MSRTSYFAQFPIINYNGQNVVDITRRVAVANSTLTNPYDFYPLDISNGARPDQTAYQAFGDPFTDWTLYLTNGIIDPYYQWYLNQEQFNTYIQMKYGSIQAAQSKVAYFINNWVGQPKIGVSAYDAYPPNVQNYFEPVYNSVGDILAYSRLQEDWTTTTNFILDIGIESPGSFICNEIVQIYYNPTSNGQAQVVASTNTDVVIQHIFNDAFPNGNVQINANSYIYGTESNSNCLISSCSFLSNNIPTDEYSFWSPVYIYDDENEANEGDKVIRVLQPTAVSTFIDDVNELLGE